MILVRLGIAYIAINDVFQHLGEKLVLQILGIESHPSDRFRSLRVAIHEKERDGLIYLLVATTRPFCIKHVRHSLFLVMRQLLRQLREIYLYPAVEHLGQARAFVAKRLIAFRPVGLRTKHHAGFRRIQEDVRGVGTRRQNPVQGHRARFVGRREISAYIVHEFVCLVIDLFLRNSQNLAEVALDGRFHRAVALYVQHMPGAQEDQSRRGQYHGQLQGQEQPGSLIPRFHFHSGFLIAGRVLALFGPQST